MIDMNTTFEKSANTTDEWYTPKEIIDALGKFDLDPCAQLNRFWQTAETMYNKNHDGLTKDWVGRVWLNPLIPVRLLNNLFVNWHNTAMALRCCSTAVIVRCSRILYLRRQRQFNFYAEGFVFSGRTEYGGFAWLWCCFDRFWRRKRRDTKNLHSTRSM